MGMVPVTFRPLGAFLGACVPHKTAMTNQCMVRFGVFDSGSGTTLFMLVLAIVPTIPILPLFRKKHCAIPARAPPCSSAARQRSKRILMR